MMVLDGVPRARWASSPANLGVWTPRSAASLLVQPGRVSAVGTYGTHSSTPAPGSRSSQIGCQSNNQTPIQGENGTETYTVDEALDAVEFGKYQTILMFYLGLGWVADAMEVLLLSFLSPAVSCDWNLSESQESWITGVVFIGMALGAYTWGSISDRYGRKAGFFMTSLFTGVLGIGSAFVRDYPSLLIVRGLVGFGLAGAPQMYSMFSEFVPTKQRGTKLLLFQMFWSIGALLEAGIAWYSLPRFGWRGLVLLSSLPSIMLSVLYPLVPESPRYLALVGSLDEAQKILQSISESNGKVLPQGKLVGPPQAPQIVGKENGFFTAQLEQIKSLVSPPLLTTSVLVWVCWIGASLGYYGVVILTTEVHAASSTAACLNNMLAFKDSDFSDVLVDSAAELPAFAIAVLSLETAGRKWSIAAGFLASAVAMAPLLHNSQDPTISLFFTRLMVSFVFATIFVYTPEVYPTSMRAMGVGIASLFSRAGGFASPFVSQQLLQSAGIGSVAGLYMVVFVASSISASLLPLETKGKKMQETIEETKLSMQLNGNSSLKNKRAGLQDTSKDTSTIPKS